MSASSAGHQASYSARTFASRCPRPTSDATLAPATASFGHAAVSTVTRTSGRRMMACCWLLENASSERRCCARHRPPAVQAIAPVSGQDAAARIASSLPSAEHLVRLLIIEDSPLVRRMYGLAFSRRGHELVDAENGRLALDPLAASGERFDLMLPDLRMPDWTAWRSSGRCAAVRSLMSRSSSPPPGPKSRGGRRDQKAAEARGARPGHDRPAASGWSADEAQAGGVGLDSSEG
jgi:CheY-like chemotaxis protein